MSYFTGATPTFTFTFEQGFHPADAAKIVITFSAQGRKVLEMNESDVTIANDKVSVYLTQEQTIAFPIGDMTVQINFVYSDGSRVPTDKATIRWERNSHDEVIEV